MTDKAGHLSTKRNSIIILAIFIVVVAACSGIYYFNKVKPYNDLLTAANKAVTEEDYDNAIKLYTEAETYKKTSDIDNKIKLAGTLKNSKENYNSAMQKMKDKDYPGAMDLFKKVDKQDSKRYSDAQDKIKECKKLYDNLTKAKNDDAAASKKQNDQAGTSEAVKNQKNNISGANNDKYIREMAIKLALAKDGLENNSNVAAYCDGPYYANGKKYFRVALKNKEYMRDGGSGTIDNLYVAEDGEVRPSLPMSY